MINEEEAFWAGIAVATMMLAGGFSMLFLQTFTGFGAIVLALGLMTMAITLQTRAKPIEHIEPSYDPSESCVPTASQSIEASREMAETESKLQPTEPEVSNEKASAEHPTEQVEISPAPQTQQAEPSESTQPAATPPEQPTQPQTPVQEKSEPPKEEKKPEEHPLILVEA